MAKPTSLLFVDGTNVDHRLWEAFGRSDVHLGRLFGAITAGTNLQHVHFCTAPYHRPPGRASLYKKQQGDLNFLRTRQDVTIHLGRHQPRTIECRSCNHAYTTYSEKGTDTFVASKLVQAACDGTVDRLYLLSGDNDFWPAVQICQEEDAEVHVAFVISPKELEQTQLNRVRQLRRYARGEVKLDAAFMAGCWR